MNTTEISGYTDIIDVRDVIARFEELETDLEQLYESAHFMSDFDDWIDNARDDSDPIHAAFGDDGLAVQHQIEEFYKLRELLRELEHNGGDEQWRGSWYPITLIRDSYFEDYAREFADDIGAINANATWPNNCIDWGRAAQELRMDYSSVDFDGAEFWYR